MRLVSRLIVSVMVFGIGAAPAMADKNDWNSYLEPPGAKPPVIKHTEMASPPAKVAKAAPAAKAAPVAKAAPKKVAQRPKSKKH